MNTPLLSRRWIQLGMAVVSGLTALLAGVEPVSRALTGARSSISAAGPSQQPHISRDGRVVVFTSPADNLVSGCHNGLATDIFAYDTETQRTELISRSADGFDGGNADSDSPMVSADGRYVVFVSRADNLVPGDANGNPDVFVRDRKTGATTLVSVRLAGDGSGNGASLNPSIRSDGLQVAFESDASDLVAGDGNGLKDIFLRDLGTSQTVRLTTAPDGSDALGGASRRARLSGDGRMLAYLSAATNIAVGPTPGAYRLHVLDRVTATHHRIGLPFGPDSEVLAPFEPSPDYTWSLDGRMLVAAARGVEQVYRLQFDVNAGSLESVRASGNLTSGHLGGWTVNGDGARIAFARSNLLQVWAAGSPSAALAVSHEANAATVSGWQPQLDDSGQRIAFISDSTQLDPKATDGRTWLYVGDLGTPAFRAIAPLVSAPGDSAPPGGFEFSADAKRLVFESNAPDAVAGDRNGAPDVFLADLVSGSIELLSRRAPDLAPVSAAGSSRIAPGCLSADGRMLVFTSTAADLVEGDSNGTLDVFAMDLQTRATQLVSVAADGSSSGSHYSGNPALSADGRYVAFISPSTNLVEGDVSSDRNKLFLHDLVGHTTRLIATNVVRVSPPRISADGSRILFVTDSTPRALAAYDRGSGTTRILQPNYQGLDAYQISADGTTATVHGPSLTRANFTAIDTASGAEVSTTSTLSSSGRFAASADGKRIAFDGRQIGVQQVYECTIGQVPALVSVALDGTTAAKGVSFDPAISADGRYVVFASLATNLTTDAATTNSQIYVRDLKNGVTRLVSLDRTGRTPANGASSIPAISADGRFVLFVSRANDLVADDENARADWFVRDLATGVTRLVSRVPATVAPARLAAVHAYLSADGSRVAFDSFSDDLSILDLNVASDAFALALEVDADADGMDDSWETAHLGGLNGGPLDDPDGDGVVNAGEFEANTDPADPGSVLRVRVDRVGPEAVELTWPGTPGRRYRVESTADVLGLNWVLHAGAQTGSGQALNLRVDSASATARLYRIVVTH